jgi:hypothetical protein
LAVSQLNWIDHDGVFVAGWVGAEAGDELGDILVPQLEQGVHELADSGSDLFDEARRQLKTS